MLVKRRLTSPSKNIDGSCRLDRICGSHHIEHLNTVCSPCFLHLFNVFKIKLGIELVAFVVATSNRASAGGSSTCWFLGLLVLASGLSGEEMWLFTLDRFEGGRLLIRLRRLHGWLPVTRCQVRPIRSTV